MTTFSFWAEEGGVRIVLSGPKPNGSLTVEIETAAGTLGATLANFRVRAFQDFLQRHWPEPKPAAAAEEDPQ